MLDNMQGINSHSAKWFVYLKPNPQARLRLFCFPYAGGGASIFRAWPDSLPTTVEVCLLQLPGRETRIKEPPFTQILPLVKAIAQAVLPHLDKPFAFFGHSMGGLVSFELARQLRRQYDLSPVILFISATSAPHTREPAPAIYNLPDSEFLEQLRSLNGSPKEVLENAELMQLMIPILRADFAVCETYAYVNEPPFNCPISVFGGLQDKVSRERLEAWCDQTSASFSLQMLPGDHFFLRTAQWLLLGNICREIQQLLGVTARRPYL